MSEARVFQFHVSLKRLRPKVWRRVQVLDDFNFLQFHNIIQQSIGWSNSHLYAFRISRPTPSNASCSSDELYEDEDRLVTITRVYKDDSKIYLNDDRRDVKSVQLRDIFKTPGQKATYVYDLGDSWDHIILLEKVLPVSPGVQYPKCLAGRVGCPPEHWTAESEDSDWEAWASSRFNPRSVVFDRLDHSVV